MSWDVLIVLVSWAVIVYTVLDELREEIDEWLKIEEE